MIYTCTLNPSLDYYIKLNTLKPYQPHRFSEAVFEAGGKGINVSRFLSMMGIKNTALGFLGGFLGQMVLSLLKQHPHIEPQFTMIDASTRINVKLIDDKGETEINHEGPVLTSLEIDSFVSLLDGLKEDDFFILSGSIHPKYQYLYQQIASICQKKKAKLIADIDGSFYPLVLPYQPWMMKPNLFELNHYAKKELKTQEEILDVAYQIIDLGIEHLLISMGKRGSYWVTKDYVTYAKPNTVSVVHTTGAGDAMVAGFVYGIIHQLSGIDLHKKMTQCANNVISEQDINLEAKNIEIQIIKNVR